MPHKPTPEKRKCYISDKTDYDVKEEARRKVCKNLPIKYEQNGNYYCLLHLPEVYKKTDFQIEFENRLNDKDYNFIGVFFPYSINLSYKVFNDYVDFFDATFAERVWFDHSIFEAGATFSGITAERYFSLANTTFNGETLFSESEFKDNADFANTNFLGDANFELAKFIKSVDFKSAKFIKGANFDRCEFLGNVEFDYGKFSDNVILIMPDSRKRLNSTKLYLRAIFILIKPFSKRNHKLSLRKRNSKAMLILIMYYSKVI